MNVCKSLPGKTQLLTHATPEYPRQSEGDIIELTDGRLFFIWGRKCGGDDFDRGVLMGRYSHDRGNSWGREALLMEPWGEMADIMSYSLCRSPRGIHLLLLANGPDQMYDLQVYQMLSTDETATWSAPERVSHQEGYYILNNARVKLTSTGRLLAPVAYLSGHIIEAFNTQRCHCLYSDDFGITWQAGEEVALPGSALMEPGIAECADGSIYMTIRTALGRLYSARSWDGGISWDGPHPTELLSPEAPATLLRDPASDDLWIFWSNNEEVARYNMRQPPTWVNKWCDVRLRNPHAVAVSHDHGCTWSEGVIFEDDPAHSYGYISATIVDDQVMLTYNDWPVSEALFWLMNTRLRTIPLGWLREHVQ